MSPEFHIFAWWRNSLFQLELPGVRDRIDFGSLFDAARYVRSILKGQAATVVIHDQKSKSENRIPVYGSF